MRESWRPKVSNFYPWNHKIEVLLFATTTLCAMAPAFYTTTIKLGVTEKWLTQPFFHSVHKGNLWQHSSIKHLMEKVSITSNGDTFYLPTKKEISVILTNQITFRVDNPFSNPLYTYFLIWGIWGFLKCNKLRFSNS